MKKTRVAILGSTGSIGVNTLKVIERFPERFEVAALTALNSVDVLAGQAARFKPRYVAISPEKSGMLRRSLGKGTKILDVTTDLPALVASRDVDVVVLAMTGAAALEPFLSAVRSGKTVAPANKEALVMAGEILMKEARRCNARIIPVDSEQSAIFQCLEGRDLSQLRRVHLTASGGALRKVPASRHDQLSVKEILAHPRWRMGAKITVDSATLMNKGFEVIEAMRLFGLSAEQVHVVVHPEAIIHSMVEFIDGSILAQLSVTDMCLPIQYALTYPKRLPSGLKPLDLTAQGKLTFEKPDLKRFPALALALTVAGKGGTLPAVLNAADEVAVEAFLKGRIRFTDIYKVVEKVIRSHRNTLDPKLDDVRRADLDARDKAFTLIER